MRILPTCTANVEFEWVGWTIHGGEQQKNGKMFSRQVSQTVTYNFNQKYSKFRGKGAGEDEKS